MSRSQFWCFTLNNYTDGEVAMLDAFDCTYMVYGREVGQAGTPHLQGYLELATSIRLTGLRTNIGLPRIHLELRKGKGYQAAAYCKKDGDFVERGVPPPAPKKEDNRLRWRTVLDHCIAGNWQWMIDNEPYLWLMNEKKMRSHFKCNKCIDVLDNEWIWGPTGTGKSRMARLRYPDAYIKDASTQWWDGYNGEAVVIIDDFDKYHVKMGYYLKIWSDHYAFPAQIKGGQMMARPQKIIITSNYAPGDIWDDRQTVEPIERRFKVIHSSNQPMWAAPVEYDQEGMSVHGCAPALPDWLDQLDANGDADQGYWSDTETQVDADDLNLACMEDFDMML